MNKKYQIFISSTFIDMKEERQAAVEAILLAGHIPAGMELFSAGDESQLDVIRRWIVDSDIFMLILGGRYGSIEPKTTKSYVELEYLHAVENGKPHFAIVLTDAALDRKIKTQGTMAVETERQSAYRDFKASVVSKISRPVDDPKDIKLYTMEAIRHAEQRQTLVGWIRANETTDVQPLLQRISDLTAQANGLQAEVDRLAAIVPPEPALSNLAGLDEKYVFHVRYWNFKSERRDEALTHTWGQIFSAIAPQLLTHPHDNIMKAYITEQLLSLNSMEGTTQVMNEQDFQAIKIQFEALGLIKTDYAASKGSGMQLYWGLTEHGRKTMVELRAVRAGKP